MSALSLSYQILLMFEAHWPMKAFPSSTRAMLGGESGGGGDVALNSLLRTCISLKHPLSCRALHQAGRVYGQVESVFLMDLSLEKPAAAVFINPARFRFWDIVCGSEKRRAVNMFLKKERWNICLFKLKQHYGCYCLKKKTFLTTTIYTSV